jgi:hypothetical protein
MVGPEHSTSDSCHDDLIGASAVAKSDVVKVSVEVGVREAFSNFISRHLGGKTRAAMLV